MYDVLVIGGGINGAGIARDAAGRGLSVLLVEKGDLAQATSSNSTKLIHGGLRYLEHFEFKLVREALMEREDLLHSAPHIIWPMEFILPHEPHLRPAWLIHLGLFLYDFLAKRDVLPGSKGVSLEEGVLQEIYKKGFSYADCWVEDARLVLLCAMDARAKGAEVRTRTECIGLKAQDDAWVATMRDTTGKVYDVQAKTVVNAAGPWVRRVIDENALAQPKTLNTRYSKGSHIVVPKLYDDAHAYILQQPDERIIFAIPYERDFTLIGTTDEHYDAPLRDAKIDEGEIAYLCDAISRSFKKPITPEMIVWSYSGVRPLLDSGDDKLSKVTRDYKLDLEESFGPPLLNVFGGKLTTFRKLAQQAVDMIAPGTKPWTRAAILPGGDIEDFESFEHFSETKTQIYSWLDKAMVRRLARAYGTRIKAIIGDAKTVEELGKHYGDDVYEAELRYVIKEEWVREAEDFLWRRSKLGLHISDRTRAKINAAVPILVREICNV